MPQGQVTRFRRTELGSRNRPSTRGTVPRSVLAAPPNPEQHQPAGGSPPPTRSSAERPSAPPSRCPPRRMNFNSSSSTTDSPGRDPQGLPEPAWVRRTAAAPGSSPSPPAMACFYDGIGALQGCEELAKVDEIPWSWLIQQTSRPSPPTSGPASGTLATRPSMFSSLGAR